MSGFRIAVQAAVLMASFLVILLALDYFQFFDRQTGNIKPEERSVSVNTTKKPNYADEIVIERSSDGHFWVDAYVNDELIKFMVDTGASIVILSPDDASDLGFDLWDEEYTQRVQTPTGVFAMAPIRIDFIEIGDIRATNVRGAVIQEGVDVSLLGLSFLNQLSSYEFQGDELILRP